MGEELRFRRVRVIAAVVAGAAIAYSAITGVAAPLISWFNFAQVGLATLLIAGVIAAGTRRDSDRAVQALAIAIVLLVAWGFVRIIALVHD